MTALAPPPSPPDVASVFAAATPQARETLTQLRSLIFEAAELTGAGPLTETLKWGEPAYLTEATKLGSTVRLGWKAKQPAECRLLVNCQTSLIETFALRHPGSLRFEGARAVVFEAGEPLPTEPLRDCLTLALTYHRWRRRGSPP